MDETPPEIPKIHMPAEKPTSIKSARTPRVRPPACQSPFRVPSDHEIFAICSQQKQDKIERMQTMKSTQLRNRPIGSGRINYRTIIKPLPPKISAEEEALSKLILAPDTASQQQETLHEFVENKREIFMAQLSIETKREEIQRLEQLEREEEEALKHKEGQINLFRDQFRSFLDNDGKSTMEARKNAEFVSKARVEIQHKIKSLQNENANMRSEIHQIEEKLEDCEMFMNFSEMLTPKEWRQNHPLPELYFKDPKQMIDIIEDLQSQNMFLVRHCQEADEVLDRFKVQFEALLADRDQTLTEKLTKKVKNDTKLENINAQTADLAVKGDFLRGNEFSPEDYSFLVKEITDFHNLLGFDSIAKYDATTMLKRIEGRLDELERDLLLVEQENVGQLALEKEQKRIDVERENQRKKEQREQEEKMQRAIAQAKKPIYRRSGRPIIQRKIPLTVESREKREEQMRLAEKQRVADQNLLYGQLWD